DISIIPPDRGTQRVTLSDPNDVVGNSRVHRLVLSHKILVRKYFFYINCQWCFIYCFIFLLCPFS
ncbi:unnamed protein product, partial [Schistosoma mattheei]